MIGVKDLDRKILLELDDRSLLKACQVDSRYRQLCSDEKFWQIRYIQQYGQDAARHKPERITGTDQKLTWKNHYLQTVIDLENFPGLKEFSENVAWNTQGDWQTSFWVIRARNGFRAVEDIKPFVEAPNVLMNWFWLKRLPEVKIKSGGEIKTLRDVTPKDVYDEMSKGATKQFISRISWNNNIKAFIPIYQLL